MLEYFLTLFLGAMIGAGFESRRQQKRINRLVEQQDMFIKTMRHAQMYRRPQTDLESLFNSK